MPQNNGREYAVSTDGLGGAVKSVAADTTSVVHKPVAASPFALRMRGLDMLIRHRSGAGIVVRPTCSSSIAAMKMQTSDVDATVRACSADDISDNAYFCPACVGAVADRFPREGMTTFVAGRRMRIAGVNGVFVTLVYC